MCRAMALRIRVSRPQLCHLSRPRRACRAYGLSGAPSWPSGARRGQRWWQTVWFWAFAYEISWPRLSQLGNVPGVIVDRPGIGKGSVDSLEILPAASEASDDIGARHIVPPFLHTFGNPAERQPGRDEL